MKEIILKSESKYAKRVGWEINFCYFFAVIKIAERCVRGNRQECLKRYCVCENELKRYRCLTKLEMFDCCSGITIYTIKWRITKNIA